jgi:hypothetical protein
VRDNPAEEQVSNRGDDTSGTNSVACFAVEGDGQLSLEAIVDSGVRCAVGPSRPNRVRVQCRPRVGLPRMGLPRMDAPLTAGLLCAHASLSSRHGIHIGTRE